MACSYFGTKKGALPPYKMHQEPSKPVIKYSMVYPQASARIGPLKSLFHNFSNAFHAIKVILKKK